MRKSEGVETTPGTTGEAITPSPGTSGEDRDGVTHQSDAITATQQLPPPRATYARTTGYTRGTEGEMDSGEETEIIVDIDVDSLDEGTQEMGKRKRERPQESMWG